MQEPGAAASVLLWLDCVSQDTGGMPRKQCLSWERVGMNHVKGAPAESFTHKGWGTAADLDQMMT